MSVHFDPDELTLSKQDILDLIDAIVIFWSQNRKENWAYIAGVKTMKVGLQITPERAVKKIWNTFLKFIEIVRYENAIHGALKDNETWAETLSKIKITIAEQGIEGAMKKYSE